MEARHERVLRCLRRVREYLEANPPAGEPSALRAQIAVLDDVLGGIDTIALDQEAGARLTRAETRRQQRLRDLLWDKHMLPVSRVARAIFGEAGLDTALRMPYSRRKSERLVAAAGAMAEVAERHSAIFVESGRPRDFVQQLRKAAEQLAEALGARDATLRRRVQATAAITDQLRRGRRAVRVINATVEPLLADDPERKAAWDSARKVSASTVGSPPELDEGAPQMEKAA